MTNETSTLVLEGRQGEIFDPAENPAPSKDQLNQSLRLIARAAGDLAKYCDRVEHNEPTDSGIVRRSADTLRSTAEFLAGISGAPLKILYSRRIRELETGHLLSSADAPSTWLDILSAGTWREVQLAQQKHDRFYHPDIFGLSKQDQLRHYTLHVIKIIGSLAEVCGEPDRWRGFEAERLPDLVLFGFKMSTVAGEELGSNRLPAAFG